MPSKFVYRAANVGYGAKADAVSKSALKINNYVAKQKLTQASSSPSSSSSSLSSLSSSSSSSLLSSVSSASTVAFSAPSGAVETLKQVLVEKKAQQHQEQDSQRNPQLLARMEKIKSEIERAKAVVAAPLTAHKPAPTSNTVGKEPLLATAAAAAAVLVPIVKPVVTSKKYIAPTALAAAAVNPTASKRPNLVPSTVNNNSFSSAGSAATSSVSFKNDSSLPPPTAATDTPLVSAITSRINPVRADGNPHLIALFTNPRKRAESESSATTASSNPIPTGATAPATTVPSSATASARPAKLQRTWRPSAVLAALGASQKESPAPSSNSISPSSSAATAIATHTVASVTEGKPLFVASRNKLERVVAASGASAVSSKVSVVSKKKSKLKWSGGVKGGVQKKKALRVNSLKWAKSAVSRRWSREIGKGYSLLSSRSLLRLRASSQKQLKAKSGSESSKALLKKEFSSLRKVVRLGASMYRKDVKGKKLQRVPSNGSTSSTETTVVGGRQQNIKLQPPEKKKNFSRKYRAAEIVQRAQLNRLRASRKTSAPKYCTFFNLFGKCRHGNECRKIHDVTRVAPCTAFLRGCCDDSECTLQHTFEKDRMPICQFFQHGACYKETCPFRHVNVNPTAQVCTAFVQGHCPLGDACTLQHTYVCPSFLVAGKCAQEGKCGLRHVAAASDRKRKQAEEDSGSMNNNADSAQSNGASSLALNSSSSSSPAPPSASSSVNAPRIKPNFVLSQKQPQPISDQVADK